MKVAKWATYVKLATKNLNQQPTMNLKFHFLAYIVSLLHHIQQEIIQQDKVAINVFMELT